MGAGGWRRAHPASPDLPFAAHSQSLLLHKNPQHWAAGGQVGARVESCCVVACGAESPSGSQSGMVALASQLLLAVHR